MGRRGPPPTPTAKLSRRGSWRAAERAAEPDALEALPPRPQLGEIATAVWDTYEPILREMRVLSRSDGMALELLARTYEEWKLAIQEIEKYGLLTMTEKGIAANPAVPIRDRAEVRLKNILAELGLTPSGRARVKVEPKKEKKGLDDLD